MSPKTLVAILIWGICLGGLFFGMLTWGRYVQERDEARRNSKVLTLCRGDLPSDEFVVRSGNAEMALSFDALMRGAGSQQKYTLLTVTSPHSHARVELLYVFYRTRAEAAQALTHWRAMFGLPSTTTDALAITSTDRALLAAGWQRGPVVVLALAREDSATQALLRRVIDAADSRMRRVLSR